MTIILNLFFRIENFLFTTSCLTERRKMENIDSEGERIPLLRESKKLYSEMPVRNSNIEILDSKKLRKNRLQLELRLYECISIFTIYKV